jgi:hypothetical protein
VYVKRTVVVITNYNTREGVAASYSS